MTMALKPVEIVVELLNEGMNEGDIKNELVDMGLSGREIYKLMADARKLRKEGEAKQSKDSEKLLDKIRKKEKEFDKEEPRGRSEEEPVMDRHLMEQKLQKLKSSITGSIEQHVTYPQASPPKPSVSEAEEDEGDSEDEGGDEGDTGEGDREVEGMLREAEGISDEVEDGGQEPGEDEEEMNNEKLDQIAEDLDQIKRSLKVLEELNIKLVELLKSER